MGKDRNLICHVGALLVFSLGWAACLAANTQPIEFGFSADGSPVSYSEILTHTETGNVQGFCGGLANALKAKGYVLIPHKLEISKRFAEFATVLQGKPGIQCGPDSVTRSRLEKLQALEQGVFSGFSTPFAVTSTKLLIRRDKLPTLYQQPDKLRIGLLEAPDKPGTVTTVLIKSVFPTALPVGVSNRAEAIQRLSLPEADAAAIDAYASDEIMLADILANELPKEIAKYGKTPADYVIDPPLYGYSREEYAVVVYNAPEVLAAINEWLASVDGQAAAARLRVRENSFMQVLQWVVRGDHLPKVRLVGVGVAVLLALWIALCLWWRLRSKQDPAPLQPPAVNVPDAESPPPSAPENHTPTPSAAVSLLSPFNVAADLTPRQLEVALLWAEGDPAGIIAKKLDIPSQRTVETHIRAIYQKTSTNNRIELRKYLQEHQLL